MKKAMLLVLCICLVVTAPVSATTTMQSDDHDENGTPIYYIDVSPEEWEKTFLDHPFYQNYDPQRKAIFMLRDSKSSRAICYNCGKNSMSLQRAWQQWYMDDITCPGNEWNVDIMGADYWTCRDYCNSCGPLTNWMVESTDRYDWSWYVLCTDPHGDGGRTYNIYLYKSLNDGYNSHEVLSITEPGKVHGLNCSCTGNNHR